MCLHSAVHIQESAHLLGNIISDNVNNVYVSSFLYNVNFYSHSSEAQIRKQIEQIDF